MLARQGSQAGVSSRKDALQNCSGAGREPGNSLPGHIGTVRVNRGKSSSEV